MKLKNPERTGYVLFLNKLLSIILLGKKYCNTREKVV